MLAVMRTLMNVPVTHAKMGAHAMMVSTRTHVSVQPVTLVFTATEKRMHVLIVPVLMVHALPTWVVVAIHAHVRLGTLVPTATRALTTAKAHPV